MRQQPSTPLVPILILVSAGCAPDAHTPPAPDILTTQLALAPPDDYDDDEPEVPDSYCDAGAFGSSSLNGNRDRYIKLDTNLFHYQDQTYKDPANQAENLAFAESLGFTHVLWVDQAIENALYRNDGVENFDEGLKAFLNAADAQGLRVVPSLGAAGYAVAILKENPNYVAAARVENLKLIRASCPAGIRSRYCYRAADETKTIGTWVDQYDADPKPGVDQEVGDYLVLTSSNTEYDYGGRAYAAPWSDASAPARQSWRFSYRVDEDGYKLSSSSVDAEGTDGSTRRELSGTRTCEHADDGYYYCHHVFNTLHLNNDIKSGLIDIRLRMNVNEGQTVRFTHLDLRREGLVNMVRRDTGNQKADLIVKNSSGKQYAEGLDFKGQCDGGKVCDPYLGLGECNGKVCDASEGHWSTTHPLPYIAWNNTSAKAPPYLLVDFLQASLSNPGGSYQASLELLPDTGEMVKNTIRWIDENDGYQFGLHPAISGFNLGADEIRAGGFDDDVAANFGQRLADWVYELAVHVETLQAEYCKPLTLTIYGDMFNEYQNANDYYYLTDDATDAKLLWSRVNGTGQPELIHANWELPTPPTADPTKVQDTDYEKLLQDEDYRNEPTLLLGFYDSHWDYCTGESKSPLKLEEHCGTAPYPDYNNQLDRWYLAAEPFEADDGTEKGAVNVIGTAFLTWSYTWQTVPLTQDELDAGIKLGEKSDLFVQLKQFSLAAEKWE